jgi:hypothetical protein
VQLIGADIYGDGLLGAAPQSVIGKTAGTAAGVQHHFILKIQGEFIGYAG